MPKKKSTSKEIVKPEPPPPPRAAVDSARVETVIQWLIGGNRETHVIESIREHWPEQDLELLINAAAAKLTEAGQVEPDAVRGFCIEATRELYRKLNDSGDHLGALKAVKQLYELSR